MAMMTAGQYAKHIGVSAAAVGQAIKRGRITAKKVGRPWMIDPDVADAQWYTQVRPQHLPPRHPGRTPAPGAPLGPERRKPKSGATIPEVDMPITDSDEIGDDVSLAEATRLLQLEKLRNAKAENDINEGKLLDAEDVRKTWERHRESVKNRLMLLPSKVPQMCREQIEREVRAALEEMSTYHEVA